MQPYTCWQGANERPASHSQEIGKLTKYYPGWKNDRRRRQTTNCLLPCATPPNDAVSARLRNVDDVRMQRACQKLERKESPCLQGHWKWKVIILGHR